MDTPENQAQKESSKRSSQILDSFGQLDDARNPEEEKLKDQHVSAFLRENGDKNSPQNSTGSRHSPPNNTTPPSLSERMPRPGFLQGEPDTTDSNSPQHTVARADLRASAEKILYTYLLPGSEREIILPQSILNDIIVSIEEDHRDDPEVFDAAKDYVFQAMERDAFPGFLRSKALGNLVPPSMFARLVLGLLAIFGGLWAGFACIFLDLDRRTRCWVCQFFLLRTSRLIFLAHSPLHHRRLLARLSAICPRSDPRASGLQRVHFHELGADPRPLRAQPPESACADESTRYGAHRDLGHRTVHFRTRQATVR
jgi:Regulator of G protein signaling domain